MSRKPYTCILFDGKSIVAEYKLYHWRPEIREPKPLDMDWYPPNTYPMDFNKIESLNYAYVGELPDGRLMYALEV